LIHFISFQLKALEMAIVKTSGKLNLERSETSQLGISVNKKLSELVVAINHYCHHLVT